MKLWELSGNTGDNTNQNAALRNIVIQGMREAAPILEFVEFYTMAGNSDKPRKGSNVTGGASRALDNGYEDNLTTPEFGDVALKIYGDLIKTDIAHIRRGEDVPSLRAADLMSFSQGLGRHLQNHIVNGDSADNAKYFDGLKKQIGADQIILLSDVAGSGLVQFGNSDAAKRSQQSFLLALDTLIESVSGGADCLMMAPKTISYLESFARELVRVVDVNSSFKGKLKFYKDIPLVNAGYNKDEDGLVIGYEEVVDQDDDCTSVYAPKFGEKQRVTFATNVGVEVSDLGKVGVHYQTLVDFDIDMEILSDKCAWRLEGIRLA